MTVKIHKLTNKKTNKQRNKQINSPMALAVILSPVMFHLTQAKLFLINNEAKENPKQGPRTAKERLKVSKSKT